MINSMAMHNGSWIFLLMDCNICINGICSFIFDYLFLYKGNDIDIHLRVISEWDFSPEDLFEGECDFSIPGCEILVASGTFKVTVTDRLSRSDAMIRADVEQELRALLAGAQLLQPEPTSLSLRRFSRATDDGRLGATIFVEADLMVVSEMSVDIVLTDKDGHIISDTKADRVRDKQSSAKRVLCHSDDPTLRAVVDSFQASRADSENELIYIFEIRDALNRRFGGQSEALRILGVKQEWNCIGRLANNTEIREGRHRGIFRATGLRRATSDELRQARESATRMIEAYLDHLDAASSAS